MVRPRLPPSACTSSSAPEPDALASRVRCRYSSSTSDSPPSTAYARIRRQYCPLHPGMPGLYILVSSPTAIGARNSERNAQAALIASDFKALSVIGVAVICERLLSAAFAGEPAASSASTRARSSGGRPSTVRSSPLQGLPLSGQAAKARWWTLPARLPLRYEAPPKGP